MSNDEEMIIRGRLTTDYATAKQRKTILQTERDRLGKLIAAAGSRIQGLSPFQSASPTEEQYAAFDADKIRELMRETDENDALLTDLSGKLRDLGFL